MAEEDPKRPVLHVVVVGFHHQRGSEVEYSFPPIVNGEESWSKSLPVEWKALPFMALPDGAHNYDSESTYFHLPSLSPHGSRKQTTLFVVSCYRQIKSKDLKIKTQDITRDTVQKSVCIISRMPLYGYLQAKLEVATKVYFEEKDFSQVRILQDLYHNLNCSLMPDMMTESLLHVGLSPSELIIKFRQRVLVLFKLLLLEKKVLFFGYPVMAVCSLLLSLVSLMPRILENGLGQAALTKNESDYNEQDCDPLYPAHLNDNQLNTDQFGLPLAIFTNNSILHPYLCLQQMDVIKNPKVDSFVIGASNALYQHQRQLFDVIVDLETSNVEILDQQLKDDLTLSTADLRFTDYVVQHVEVHEENQETGWDGSDEWIRAQFKVYLMSLLATVHRSDEDDMENFNKSFLSSWKKTHNYSVWSSQKHVGIDEVHSGHPFQGQVGLNDLKIRLAYAYQDVAAKSMQTEQGRKIGQAVAQTSRAVGGAISSARSYVTSWLADFAKEKPQLQEQTTADENINGINEDEDKQSRDVKETKQTRDITEPLNNT